MALPLHSQVSNITYQQGSCLPPDQAHWANVDYFVDSYGIIESVELSNLDNPASVLVNCVVLNNALNDAGAYLDNAILRSAWCGGEAIKSLFKRYQIILARHYMDHIRRRPEVRQDYDDVMKLVTDASTMICKGPRPADQASLASLTIKFRAEPRIWCQDYLANMPELERY